VLGAVPRRAVEFAAGRALARAALADLGAPVGPIGVGVRREPLWPQGIVGSITHCEGFAAAVTARRQHVEAVGIDAEPARRVLPTALIRNTSSAAERASAGALGPFGPLVVFCAKEATFKAWYPLTGRWLGFQDVVIGLMPSDRRFTVRVLREDPIGLSGAVGHWQVKEEFLVTTLVLLADRCGTSGESRAGLGQPSWASRPSPEHVRRG